MFFQGVLHLLFYCSRNERKNNRQEIDAPLLNVVVCTMFTRCRPLVDWKMSVNLNINSVCQWNCGLQQSLFTLHSSVFSWAHLPLHCSRPSDSLSWRRILPVCHTATFFPRWALEHRLTWSNRCFMQVHGNIAAHQQAKHTWTRTVNVKRRWLLPLNWTVAYHFCLLPFCPFSTFKSFNFSPISTW